MKAKVYKTICLIVALIVAVITAGYAFAWYLDHKDSEFELSGASAGAYFDSGNGSKETPFVIANSTHMRNLAVLQNMGRFVDENGNPKIYYFEIKKTIDELDMGDDLWLPPIGNDDAPFIGVFNGNGKSIKNLKVTTDKTLLKEENYPVEASASYKFSNAVGLFGNTGKSSEIRNFILNNPVLLVGSTSKTTYSTGAAKVVGLAVGHVAGKCQSIGVRATSTSTTYLQVADANTKYSTFNSILGELGDGVESSVTGGGHVAGEGAGGSGAAFGSSFDVENMIVRLNKMSNNNGASWRIPAVDKDTNDFPVLRNNEKIPFTVTEESTYDDADAAEVVSNQNMGYYIGNQNKINRKRITFSDKLENSSISNDDDEAILNSTTGSNWTQWTYPDGSTPLSTKKTPKWFYTNDKATVQGGTSYAPASGFRPLTQAEMDDLPVNIKNILVDDDENPDDNKQDYMTIRFSNMYYLSNNVGEPQDILNSAYQNAKWNNYGQISWMGKTYYRGFRGTDGKVVNENGVNDGTFVDQWGGTNPEYNYYDGGVYLPNDVIWFKPAQAGKFRFVMYDDRSSGTIGEDDAGSGNGRSFLLAKVTRTSATPENPFYSEVGSSDIKAEVVMAQNISSPYVLLYFEYDVSQTEIDAANTEYFLSGYNGNGAYFVYLDIGASAAEDEDISGVVPDAVSAVDFIYDGVEIEQTDTTIGIGNFIVNASGNKALYDASKTSIYFENLTTALKIVYVRLHNETGKHSGKTICLEGSVPELNTSSEVKATYATYVCPTISGGSGTVSGGGGGGGTVTPTPGPDDPDDVVETSVDFKAIFDATAGEADGSGRKDITGQVTHNDKVTLNGGKISEDSYNNQGNTFSVTLSGTVSNSITLAGTGASGSGATVSIVITDANDNEVGRSSQEAASGENVDLTVDNLAAGTYNVSVVKTNGSGSGSVKFTEISITENNAGTVTPGPGPDDPTPSGTVNDYIDISGDTNGSGHSISFTSENGYFTVQGVGNYKYSTVLDGALIGTSTGRGLIITAGDNVESITFTIKLGISDDSKYGSSSAASTANVTGDKTETLTSESGGTVYEYVVTLNQGETITITGTRNLALVAVTAVVTKA